MSLLQSSFTSIFGGGIDPFNESTDDLLLRHLADFDHAELARRGTLRCVFDFELVVATFNLAEADIIGACSQNKASDSRRWLQIGLGNLVHAIDDERLAQRAIVASILCLGDTSKDNAT